MPDSPDHGLVTLPSKHSVQETLSRLETLLQEKGLQIFARIDHSGEAEKVGLKMNKTRLLVFGSPKAGTPLMQAAPTLAIDLPLKVLVWEDSSGKTWLTYNDPATRTMVYVNAGHNPPILRRPSGAIERLQAGGIPLGILETTPYAAGSVVLEEGDWLVVFTDGVVEAENVNGEEYGEPRLMFVVQTGTELSPEQLLRNVTGDLDRFVGGAPQHDDVTCMLVKAVAARQ